MNRKLASLFLLPLAAFASPFSGSFGITAGIRADLFISKMFAPGVKAIDKYSKFTSWTVGGRGRFGLYDAFLRFEGDWGRPIGRGEYSREVNGTVEHRLGLIRKNTEGGYAALGYSFYYLNQRLRLGPEVGFMARRFVLANDTNENVAAPFFGIELEGIITSHFSTGLNFDYYFAGMRRSEYDMSSNPPLINKGGSYSGPQFDINFVYEPFRHFAVGLHYTFTYIYTNDEPYAIYDAENQSWMTNALRMSFSGQF